VRGRKFGSVDDAVRTRIVVAWCELPVELREAPASEAELQPFEAAFVPIPPEFRCFLSACGGGPVGTEWVDRIAKLEASDRKFRLDWDPQRGWSITDVFIIGWDGGGNPFPNALRVFILFTRAVTGCLSAFIAYLLRSYSGRV
jgi:hypothetical protein